MKGWCTDLFVGACSLSQHIWRSFPSTRRRICLLLWMLLMAEHWRNIITGLCKKESWLVSSPSLYMLMYMLAMSLVTFARWSTIVELRLQESLREPHFTIVLLGSLALLSLELIGAVGARNYAKSSLSQRALGKVTSTWTQESFNFKGRMTRQIFFWLIRISVSQNLPESNKSSYWAGDVAKNTVKSWNSQMNFHSVEILPRDVNCRKRHHSGSTLLHMRACAIGSQSPTSTTLSHFWLLGSKYEHEMGPKTKQIPKNSLSLAYS